MRTPARLETITTDEHARLREALARFGAALAELEEEQKRLRAPVFTQNLFGEPVLAAPIVAEKKRLYEIDGLVIQWRLFSRGCAARLDRVRDELLPVVRRWHAGHDAAHGPAVELVAALQQDRALVESRLAGVRTQVVFVEPLKPVLHSLTQALEEADVAEESEVFPAILAGSRESMQPEARRRTSTDVARSLRMSRPPASEREREPDRGGLFARIRRLFGR